MAPAGPPSQRNRGRSQLAGNIAPGALPSDKCGSITQKLAAPKLSGAPNPPTSPGPTPSSKIGLGGKSEQFCVHVGVTVLSGGGAMVPPAPTGLMIPPAPVPLLPPPEEPPAARSPPNPLPAPFAQAKPA